MRSAMPTLATKKLSDTVGVEVLDADIDRLVAALSELWAELGLPLEGRRAEAAE